MEESKDKDTFKKLATETEDAICSVISDGLEVNDLDILYKLTKIHKYAKEEDGMYRGYGNYGNYNAGGNYGNYNDSYGRRGYDKKYRGHEHLDGMYNEYGRYEEGREQYNRGNYGAKDDTLRSLEYMLKSMVQFTNMLKQDANSPEEMELIRQYTRQISEM